MKLKPGGKIAIFLVLGVLAFFLVRRFLPQNKAADSSVTTTATTGNDGNASSDSTATKSGSEQKSSNNTAAKTQGRTFDYTPEKPVNGKLRGVVEVAATGFN